MSAHRYHALVFVALLAAAPAWGRVDNFVLLDADGKAQELYYHGDAPAIAILSHANDCTASQPALAQFEAAHTRFAARGVAFMVLDPVDDRTSAVRSDASIPVLLDETRLVTQSLDIARTGEALLIAPGSWEVVYRGPASGLDAALAAVIGGGDVAPAREKSPGGCPLELASVDGTTVSYSETIAPLLEAKCVACHRPGGIGPWAMTSYEMVRGFSPMIREVIRTRRMPPWHADPHVGTFHGDRSLTVAQKQTLVGWIEAGAPRGTGPDPLTQVRAADGSWPLAAEFGEPDLVLTLPPFEVPETGVVDYQFPSVPNPLDRDVWVRAASIAAGDRTVVHHVLAGSVSGETPIDRMDNVFENYLIGYAPGAESLVYPEGTGVFIRKGGHFAFQLHYTPVGKPATDVTRMALYFYDSPPKQILRHQVIVDPMIRIPPNAPAHEESAYYAFHKDAVLYSVFPHAHYRGRTSSFTLEYPDGREKLLLSVPRYDFNWQREYAFTKPLAVPAGSKLVHRTVYDNSASNPGNPDPNKLVTWGLQSADEMLYGAMMFRWADETSAHPTHDARRADLAQMYGFMDRNRNERLEWDEMPKRMQDSFGENFARADANADGGLDMQEFTANRQRVGSR